MGGKHLPTNPVLAPTHSPKEASDPYTQSVQSTAPLLENTASESNAEMNASLDPENDISRERSVHNLLDESSASVITSHTHSDFVAGGGFAEPFTGACDETLPFFDGSFTFDNGLDFSMPPFWIDDCLGFGSAGVGPGFTASDWTLLDQNASGDGSNSTLQQHPALSDHEPTPFQSLEGTQLLKQKDFKEILNNTNFCFPDLKPEDEDAIISEDFSCTAQISDENYQMILRSFESLHRCTDPNMTCFFPSLHLLDIFVQLYFEYFHPQVPLLHIVNFSSLPTSWLLITAMAAIGCRYSMITGYQQYVDSLEEFVRRVILHHVRHPSKRKCCKVNELTPNKQLEGRVNDSDISFPQSVLLHNFCMMFKGTKDGYTRFGYQRNLLITLCRPFIARHKSGSHISGDNPEKRHGGDWGAWIECESQRRLVYFTWNEPITNSMVQCLSDLGRFTVMITAYAEERRLLHASRNWISKLAIQETLRLSDDDYGADPQDLMSRRLRYPQTLLDAEHVLFMPVPNSTQGKPAQTYFHGRLYPVLAILRCVPLGTLHTFSGWKATKADATLAGQELSIWINQEHVKARQSLRHAALLFGDIRSGTSMTFYDPLCLLTATLFIWTYAQLAEWPSLPSSSETQPIRLDQQLDESTVRLWESHGQHRHVHITGIGLLARPNSAARTLKEATRILMGRRAWSRLNYGIAQAFSQLIDGKSPSIDV
ncbi:hypothetical protein BKA61DRAFT_565730 [Leptodontidium sp. MPI-SDFR-AT-0119]|nr:hypothetical protein BKA61DRAFT_565730 [Leptodontidium sp. MPI-SDFR-AT-0119]